MSRLLAIDTDGTDPQELGQRRSEYDAYVRQFDGAILDWLPGEDGDVLMSQEYIPEAGRIGTRLIRKKEGLAVERIGPRTLKKTIIEPESRRATCRERMFHDVEKPGGAVSLRKTNNKNT